MNIDYSNMTEQEVFDLISNHMLTTKKQAIHYLYGDELRSYMIGDEEAKNLVNIPEDKEHADQLSVYVGDDGTKSAAGILIPDDKYEPAMNMMPWWKIVEQYNLSPAHLQLITDLQDIHNIEDEDGEWRWKEMLSDYADEHDLEFHPVK